MADAKLKIPKVQVLAWLPGMLAEELRRHVDGYRQIARRLNVGSPLTISQLITEAVDRELTRRKERAEIRHPAPAIALEKEGRAGRDFMRLLQFSLQAVDLSADLRLDGDVLVAECPAFCREAMEEVLVAEVPCVVHTCTDSAEWTSTADVVAEMRAEAGRQEPDTVGPKAGKKKKRRSPKGTAGKKDA